jgi:hypothetical protein
MFPATCEGRGHAAGMNLWSSRCGTNKPGGSGWRFAASGVRRIWKGGLDLNNHLNGFFTRHVRRGSQVEDWRAKWPTLEDEKAKLAENRRQRIAEIAASDEADVTLHVPVLKVDEINFEVNDLRARVALAAAVANLVSLNVGADLSVDRIKLLITGVEAQAILRVKLEKVAEIVERTLATIDSHPELLASLLRPVGELVGQVGHAVGETVPKLGEAVSDTVKETVPVLGEALRETVPAVGQTLRETVPTVGQTLRETVPAVSQTVRETVPAVGQTVQATVPTVGQTVREAAPAVGQTVRETAPAVGPAAPRETVPPGGHAARDTEPAVGQVWGKVLSVVPRTATATRRAVMVGPHAAFKVAGNAARAARRMTNLRVRLIRLNPG